MEKIRGRGKLSKMTASLLEYGDFILTVLVLILVIFGVVMVFSASYYDSISGASNNPYYYLIRSSAWAVMGIGVMIITSYIPYKIYFKFAVPIAIISILLLAALFTPLGVTRNYATRWLDFGITIMPGEIAKLAAIIFVAWYFTKLHAAARSLLKGVLPMLLLVGIYFLLIVMQPNLSTALIISAIIIGMTFIAGMKWGYLLGTLGGGAAAVWMLIMTSDSGHFMKRISVFLDPMSDPSGDGYQLSQSLIAFGAGGLKGVGLGKSIQKALYLPEAQNDFIFAIIAEEWGFLGCLAVLAVYAILIWKCASIALNAPDRFGMLLASGITLLIGIQAVMNIAVVTSSIPATGVGLPFISYGGNAMIIMMAAMGILLNISKATAVKEYEGRGLY